MTVFRDPVALHQPQQDLRRGIAAGTLALPRTEIGSCFQVWTWEIDNAIVGAASVVMASVVPNEGPARNVRHKSVQRVDYDKPDRS